MPKNQATFMAEMLNDLLAALKVRLLSTISRFGRLAKGTYAASRFTKSQWISSDSTTTRCSRQISPIRVRSSADQALPVGFCGLHRMKALARRARRSKSSKSIR